MKQLYYVASLQMRDVSSVCCISTLHLFIIIVGGLHHDNAACQESPRGDESSPGSPRAAGGSYVRAVAGITGLAKVGADWITNMRLCMAGRSCPCLLTEHASPLPCLFQTADGLGGQHLGPAPSRPEHGALQGGGQVSRPGCHLVGPCGPLPAPTPHESHSRGVYDRDHLRSLWVRAYGYDKAQY